MTKEERSKRVGAGNNCGRTESFRRQIAGTVIQENLTLFEAEKRFDIPYSTICRWVTRYYDDIEQTNIISSMNHPPNIPPAPLPELAEYESKLKLAQLKITALDTMIDIAEKMYKIDIRKNVGTKQQE